MLLHGSGRNGLSLAEKWKDLASKEGIILAGPDAANPNVWSPSEDGPDFLRDLVENLESKYPINPHRVYLFGHSGGAVYALTKREIVLALVDRIIIDTVREGNETRTAGVRYAFDPPPIQRYTQRFNLRYPEILSPVSTVVDYLTCV